MKTLLATVAAFVCASSVLAQAPPPPTETDHGDFRARPEMLKDMTASEARLLSQNFAKAKNGTLAETAGPTDAQGREHRHFDFDFEGPNGGRYRLDVAVLNGKVADWELITWTGKVTPSLRSIQVGMMKTMLEAYQSDLRLSSAQKKSNAVEDLVDSYRVVIVSNWREFNFVKVASKGSSILATHSLFSRSSFEIGRGGRAVQQ